MSDNRPRKLGNEAQRAEYRTKAYAMRLKGHSLNEIGVELGFSRETARKLISEYVEALTIPLAEQMRKTEDDKLNRREAMLWGFLADKYEVVSHGKVVTKADGKPVNDIEPLLKTDAALGRIAERRAALWGLNTPVKTEHTVTTTSVVDENIKALLEQMDAQNDAEIQKLSE